jgi:hypothetical protein
MNPANDWFDQARGLLDVLRQGGPGPGGGDGHAGGPAGGHAGDCRWCPVCQAAAVVRGERPEVTVAVADVLTAAAAALRSLAESDRPGTPRAEAAPADAAEPADPPGTAPPVVQKIEIA